VDALENPYPEHPGLNLMFETREGLLKHCSLERAKALGPVAARHLTGESPPLEVQAVDVADQIAYLFGDLEDAVDRFVLTPDQLLAQYWFRDAWEKIQPGISAPTAADLIDPIRSPMARARLGSVWRSLLADSVNDVIASSRARLELLGVHSLADVRRHDTLVDLSAERRQIHKDIRSFSRAQIYSNAALLTYRSFSVEALGALHENVAANPTHWGFSPAPRPEKVRDWLASLTDRTVLRWYVDNRPGISMASSSLGSRDLPQGSVHALDLSDSSPLPAPTIAPAEHPVGLPSSPRPPRTHRSSRRPHP
jgi:dGTPase